jgi:hypothetical protein
MGSMRKLNRLSRSASNAILITAICAVPSTAQGEATRRIVVHDSAKTPGPHMAGALVIATTLLQSDNVRFEWHNPSEAPDLTTSDDATRRPTIIVASSSSFERDAFRPVDVLGRVVQPNVRAYVLYDRVVELARHYRVDPTVILGQVIAYESGHLVFGEQHSSAGFMAGRIRPGSMLEDSSQPAAE